jgi:hypothetical protein
MSNVALFVRLIASRTLCNSIPSSISGIASGKSRKGYVLYAPCRLEIRASGVAKLCRKSRFRVPPAANGPCMQQVEPSILVRLFGFIDNDKLDGAFSGFQPEPELLR